MNLSQDQLSDAFNFIGSDGAIDADDLQFAMHGLGFGNRSREEAERLIDSVTIGSCGRIEQEDFNRVVADDLSDEDSTQVVLTTFVRALLRRTETDVVVSDQDGAAPCAPDDVVPASKEDVSPDFACGDGE